MTWPEHTVRLASGLFALTAVVIGIVWWWLGTPVQLPPSPLAAGSKFYCVSYAPFRDGQDPLVEGTQVTAAQIDEDLALVAKYSTCIRTYSVNDGAEAVLESARRHGLKVLYGIWVSNDAAKTRQQIATAVAFAKKYPDVISAMIVGNEVLLRGDISPPDLMAYIRAVKAEVSVPVSYADVREFWLRYPDVQNVVDFVTIHILPYWEDFPLPASRAAAHVEDIRAKVAAAIPNKEIVIGEFGWPSAGRMREDARPSPSNQALAIQETMALAQRENFRVNIIEAFDQSWKRWLEGTVGGYWGVLDRTTQAPKFTFGGAVSDHPHAVAQALAGILLSALTFGAAFLAGRDTANKERPALFWPKIAAMNLVPAILFGWTLGAIAADSFTIGGWLRALAFALFAAAAPVVCAVACAAKRAPPSFAALLDRSGERRCGLNLAIGLLLMGVVLLATQAALGLVFDPRYRDIPFAPLSAAVVPFLVLQASVRHPAGPRGVAEMLAAGLFAAAAVYVAINESFANWQAVWFCAGLLGLAVILVQVRDAPSSG